MWAAWLAVVLVVLTGVPAVADEPDATAITPPRLSYLNGSVSFWRPGAEQWTAAQLNTALAPGDQLHTGHLGTVELQVGGRAFVRAWGDSELALVDQTPDSQRLRIADGHVVADLRALDPGGILHIETPGASFTLDRPGYYRVDVREDVTSLTTRRDGQEARTTRVEGGASQTIAAPPLDAWDRWNQARTDELLYVTSTRYVPESVYGARDLDDHGDWRVVPTYGAVWVPRGAAAGWAPYTTGHWVWDPRFGWTWVDTAVWGWAPFHYGRWVYLGGVWAWAPGPVVVRPVYAPALVAFFHAPGVRVTIGTPFVSWVALGWGEPVVPWWGRAGFVGRPAWVGWGGPRVVNNVVINRTTVVNATDIRVYRNTTVNRAVVAVAPERFGRGRVEDARVTTIDTRRLEPVRGPVRGAPEVANRTEAPSRPARVPDADRGRPDAERGRRADGVRPQPRPETPARPPSVSRPDTAPRPPQPTGEVSTPRDSAPRVVPRTEPRPRQEPPVAEPPRRSDEPARPAMPPRMERPRNDRGDSPDRVGPGRSEREERRGPAASAPAVPSVNGAAARESARPTVAPRVETRPRPEPAAAQPPRRAEPPARPELSPRIDRGPERREMPDRVGPGRRQQEERRGPAASAPTVRGAASHERQERGDGRSGGGGRPAGKNAPGNRAD